MQAHAVYKCQICIILNFSNKRNFSVVMSSMFIVLCPSAIDLVTMTHISFK